VSRARRRVRIVPLAAVDDALEARWRRLADAAAEPNPYHDPRFLLTSARVRADARRLRLAVVEDGRGELAAVMAFGTRRGYLRSRVRIASTVGPFLREVGDLRHPLLDAGDPQRAWEDLLAGLRRSGVPGLLELANITDGGPVAGSLRAALAASGIPFRERESDDRAYAEREDMAPERADPSELFLVEHASSGTRKDDRRRMRVLLGALGEPLRVADRGADPVAIDDFLDLEAAGWKGDPGRGGHALRTIGADGWFSAVADAFRADGRLRVTSVTSGSRTIALAVSLRAGHGLFGVLDCYDESLAKHGAGRLGRIAEWRAALLDPGIDYFDPNLSSFYRESTRLYPQRRRHSTLLLATGGPVSRLLLRAGERG
jgi:CelD/BcsL family acetyltransferase involved in cellulose biosynthesis